MGQARSNTFECHQAGSQALDWKKPTATDHELQPHSVRPPFLGIDSPSHSSRLPFPHTHRLDFSLPPHPSTKLGTPTWNQAEIFLPCPQRTVQGLDLLFHVDDVQLRSRQLSVARLAVARA